MTTSKSPKKIAQGAYAAARKTFPDYSHKFSPKKFTQPQLAACLVLKEFFKKDYRGIEAILIDSSDLQEVLELKTIPHYTTLQKAAQKFFKTKGCDTANHLILSGIPERGPQFDRTHFKPALTTAIKQKRIKLLLADAGYDGEPSHVFARLVLKVKTLIPATIGRPTAKLPAGKYRRLMVLQFNKLAYGQRWQMETVISMLKRNLDSFLRARSYHTQCRAILLRFFTHNTMIVLPV